ncbi:MAG: hypothetical protein CM15mV74_050 [uncultured marine virus]|nr:MAG: hypothetical protein CM15mV74_050 [uncultured marine virus]
MTPVRYLPEDHLFGRETKYNYRVRYATITEREADGTALLQQTMSLN